MQKKKKKRRKRQSDNHFRNPELNFWQQQKDQSLMANVSC